MFDDLHVERVQKRALRIILGSSYSTYQLQEALEPTNLLSRQECRKDICIKFAIELGKSDTIKSKK